MDQTSSTSQSPVARQNAYDYDELIDCANGRLFGDGNAQLPLPPMLMFDRITRIDETGGEFGRGQVRAELDLTPEHWFFACHFNDDPVMPGCLGLDALWQMVGFFLGWTGSPGRGRARAGEIKFAGQITQNISLVEYGVDMKRIMRAGVVLGLADGWVKADGDIIYVARGLRVGLFTDL
ncbi:MAG: bifunctional 3-hydroxydecanoyl-ACP dehydratase/trans-2-decenoyl-ACP isomerase [Alphaproteobacteria bacterium]|nr:bifunctional 3-hydroxydecanoyl-ACP dehydratase/trans-2-decenoyl-ACP isomerase [Alphaproteobacteria bacterium]